MPARWICAYDGSHGDDPRLGADVQRSLLLAVVLVVLVVFLFLRAHGPR